MTVELFQVLTIVFLVVGILLGIIAVILFMTLGIRGVVSDLNGTTAKREIRNIRNRSKGGTGQERTHTNMAGHSPSYTDRMMNFGSTGKTKPEQMREMAEALASTSKLNAESNSYTTQLAETAQLSPGMMEYGNTATLYQPEYGNTATLYQPDANHTAMLYQPQSVNEVIEDDDKYGATALLKEETPKQESEVDEKYSNIEFAIQIDLGFDENAEIIE